LGLYLGLLFALMFVPTSFLESGHSLCLFKNLFGIECPGCGMTRALSGVLHGDFAGAFQYNKMIVAVFPLLAYLFIKAVAKELRQLSTRSF
jgi:hypothetical protein